MAAMTFDPVQKAFLDGMPKAELHLHIEGTLMPALRLKMAQRNKIDIPYKTVADVRAAEQFVAPDAPTYLRLFLKHYFDGIAVMRTAEDFYELTVEHLTRCRDENVVYTEIMVDPQAHTERGVPFAAVMEGLTAGRNHARENLGVESIVIMCINRDKSLESAQKMFEDAKQFRADITGLGMDSEEAGHPPLKFQDVYDRARVDGYRLTAHCDVDQVNAVQHIWWCLDGLKVDRIDHGINAIEDPRLVETLKERAICMTPCPTWRTVDTTPRRVDRIRTMFDLGLSVTVNTDDPGIFESGTMGTMLAPVAAAGKFTDAEMARLMINAFAGSWLPKEKREAYIDRVNEYTKQKARAA